MYRYDFATKELLGVIQHAAPGGSLPWKRDGATAILNTEKTILMIFGGSQVSKFYHCICCNHDDGYVIRQKRLSIKNYKVTLQSE